MLEMLTSCACISTLLPACTSDMLVPCANAGALQLCLQAGACILVGWQIAQQLPGFVRQLHVPHSGTVHVNDHHDHHVAPSGMSVSALLKGVDGVSGGAERLASVTEVFHFDRRGSGAGGLSRYASLDPPKIASGGHRTSVGGVGGLSGLMKQAAAAGRRSFEGKADPKDRDHKQSSGGDDSAHTGVIVTGVRKRAGVSKDLDDPDD